MNKNMKNSFIKALRFTINSVAALTVTAAVVFSAAGCSNKGGTTTETVSDTATSDTNVSDETMTNENSSNESTSNDASSKESSSEESTSKDSKSNETSAEGSSDSKNGSTAETKSESETTTEDATSKSSKGEGNAFSSLDELRKAFDASDIGDVNQYVGWWSFGESSGDLTYGKYHIYQDGGELKCDIFQRLEGGKYAESPTTETFAAINADDNSFLMGSDGKIIAASNTVMSAGDVKLINGKVYVSVHAAGDTTCVESVNQDGSYSVSMGTGVNPDKVTGTLIWLNGVMPCDAATSKY